MENPAEDIVGVIHALTQSSPEHQQAVIRKYFVPDAAFFHPFCRVDHSTSSRWWIERIYRWYRIMSPKIELSVNSVAYDEKNLRLYAHIHQVFRIWAIPFHSAPVELVTVLDLVKYTPPPSVTESYAAVAATETDKPHPVYFIKSQNDLYQTNEFIKFVSVFRVLWALLYVWQVFATLASALGSYVLFPVTWLEQSVADSSLKNGENASAKQLVNGIIEEARSTGHDVAQKLTKRANELKSSARKDGK